MTIRNDFIRTRKGGYKTTWEEIQSGKKNDNNKANEAHW